MKLLLILLAIILFGENFIISMINAYMNYGDVYSLFEVFQFSFPESFISVQSIISYILIICVSVIGNKKNYVEVSGDKLLNLKSDAEKKINKWKIILIISCLPIIILLMSGIKGTEFLGGPVNGFEAIILNFLVYGIMYGLPITVLILILIIISIIKIILYKKEIKNINRLLDNKMDILK